ncbi:hypothetical protein [Alkalihalobacterium elongatum]|uniref:hypothetical protein n=1 Tax=Alkalihalobacterium elongatum TaxID=2675466 RepID=UPI001C1FD2F8|nr:hypothetical protein [Alkalihalobacterium elongatum]
MNKEELEDVMMEKILNVKKGKSESEIFNISRPPEDFGDAVELFYNDQEKSFKAVVYDPQTNTVFSEEDLKTETEVSSFIIKTVN